MAQRSRNADRVLARLGTRSKGVLTRKELLAAGLTSDQIAFRTESGLLIPEHPGVYRLGAATIEATYTAAIKACGEGAGLSGLPAAWLYRLIGGRPPAPEVSAPTEKRITDLKTRRRSLLPTELTSHRGIPITSVPLTLVDIASSLPQFQLGKACHEAGHRYGTTPAQVEEVLERRPNTKGAAKLRRILHGEPISLSELERLFLDLLRAHSLPLPTTNKPAGGRRVDCRWPAHRLTVELDSYTFHNSRHAWEQDRARERQAYARGDDFRRYTWDDVTKRPRPVIRELGGLLDL